jgi:hypothetical protein
MIRTFVQNSMLLLMLLVLAMGQVGKLAKGNGSFTFAL